MFIYISTGKAPDKRNKANVHVKEGPRNLENKDWSL